MNKKYNTKNITLPTKFRLQQEEIHQFLKNFKNANTWPSWWRHQVMAKVTFFNFFIKTYFILLIQYMYKISCKMNKHFPRYSKPTEVYYLQKLLWKLICVSWKARDSQNFLYWNREVVPYNYSWSEEVILK